MSKFVKKPVVVEAFKWVNGPIGTKYPDWFQEAIKENKIRFAKHGVLEIHTPEGILLAHPGDHVIQETENSIICCHPNLFEMLYESEKVAVGNDGFMFDANSTYPKEPEHGLTLKSGEDFFISIKTRVNGLSSEFRCILNSDNSLEFIDPTGKSGVSIKLNRVKKP